MGLIPCPCPLPCHTHTEFQAKSGHLHSASLTSQHSLPSVPSLSSPSQHRQLPQTTAHECLLTFKAHSSYVSSLAVSRHYLYSGSLNSEIRAWSRDPAGSVLENPVENTVALGNGSVKSIVVLKDKLISAHQDHKIRVWKIESGLPRKYKCIATLPTLTDRFARFFCAKDYVEVRRHKKSTWVHHVDAVSALALSRDGSLLYSASWDRTFKIWRTTNFRCLESVGNAHDDAINAIEVSDDGFIYTGSADKRIKVWKKLERDKKHSIVTILEKHQSAVNALAVSNDDGYVLYSGACDRSVLVWGRDSGSVEGHMVLVGALRGHKKAILCLAVVSELVFSGSADKTVRIWRRGIDKSYTCLAVLEGHSQPVKCLSAVVDSCKTGDDSDHSDADTSYLVYSGGLDCNIKVWKLIVHLL